ncbi:MAG: 3-deoxy-7-phosphoheptulonate synthase, partial [Clostridiales bacterium]|nr:3-deoxy-7-phosphoheptulonate synthase [Clostridiales bacterium]
VKEVLNNTHESAEFNSFVKGFLIESYIEEGNQSPLDGVYGKSITDACLGWTDTENLLLHAADKVRM